MILRMLCSSILWWVLTNSKNLYFLEIFEPREIISDFGNKLIKYIIIEIITVSFYFIIFINLFVLDILLRLISIIINSIIAIVMLLLLLLLYLLVLVTHLPDTLPLSYLFGSLVNHKSLARSLCDEGFWKHSISFLPCCLVIKNNDSMLFKGRVNSLLH